ncbi:MAG: hypothetical protein ACOX88_01970 [Christensenellales bacterium]|jgi:hypothetical protein
MEQVQRSGPCSMLFTIFTWGGLWGIFEATVGYLLHLLPFSIGWLIWYPVACFFMFQVYRKTQRTEAIVLVGLLSASIKLLNLFLPGRIDRVLNPAVSIVFEALAMAAVFLMIKHFFTKRERGLLIKAFTVLCMNTGWRAIYALYLLFLVPGWMREVSVISSTEALITFFLIHNFFTSVLLFAASLISKYIQRPVKDLENKVSASLASFSNKAAVCIKITVVVCLIGSSIALELLI